MRRLLVTSKALVVGGAEPGFHDTAPLEARCGRADATRSTAGSGAAERGLELRLRARPALDGRVLKLLCVIDEYTRECLAIEAGASLRSQDVILTLSRLMP